MLSRSFEFSLRLPHVPLSLISFEAAHSILFTGKAMRVLQETQSADIYESRVAAASHGMTPVCSVLFCSFVSFIHSFMGACLRATPPSCSHTRSSTNLQISLQYHRKMPCPLLSCYSACATNRSQRHC